MIHAMVVPRAYEEADVATAPNDGQFYYNVTDQQYYVWYNNRWNVMVRGGANTAPVKDGWQPDHDWWDIQAAVNTGHLPWTMADGTPPFNPQNTLYAAVVGDTTPTIDLFGHFNIYNWFNTTFQYYMSDGSYYEVNNGPPNEWAATTHTWDVTKDRPSKDDISTRAYIVTTPSPPSEGGSPNTWSLPFIHPSVFYLYIVGGQWNLRNLGAFLSFNYSPGFTENVNLRAVITHPNAAGQSGVGSPLRNYVSLNRFDSTGGSGNVGIGAPFQGGAWALTFINPRWPGIGPFPLGALASTFVYNCFSFTNVDTLNPYTEAYTNWGGINPFQGSNTIAIKVPPGWRPRQGGVLTGTLTNFLMDTNQNLSIYAMTKMIENADGTLGSFIISFGAANIAKLPQATLDLAASKGLVLT